MAWGSGTPLAPEDPWKAAFLFPCFLPSSFAPGILYLRDISLVITVGNSHQHGPVLLLSTLTWAWSAEAGSLSSRDQSLTGETE